MKIAKLLLIASVLITFGLFIYSTDMTEVIAAIRKIGTSGTWILLSTFTAYLIGTIGWRYCIGMGTGIPLWKLFIYRHVGETVGLFNPTSIIAGDMVKASLLKDHNIADTVALRSVVLSRIIMIVSQLFLLIMALCWLLFSLSGRLSGATQDYLWFALLLMIALLALCTYILLKKRTPVAVAATTPASKWQKFKRKITETLYILSEYVRAHPGAAVLSFSAFALHWVVGSLELYIILTFLGYEISVWDGLFMDMGIIVVKSMGAFIPGQIGIEEIGNKLVLAIIGISSYAVWLTVSILRRTRQLFWALVGFAMYLIFVRLGKISSKAA